jgi:aminoglycoside phosphotransferase (APT) family kinase protein
VKTCNRSYERLVAAIVSREVGAATLIPLPTYPDTIVYEAVSGDRRFIFKAIDPDGQDRDGIALEAWACETARSRGVPAPRIVSSDMSADRFPSSFFLMEKATGASLEELSLTDRERERVLMEFGSYLRALHEIEVPRFGWLDEDAFRTSETVGGWAHTWRTALLDEVPDSLHYLCGPDRLSGAEGERIRAVIEEGAPFLDGFSDGRLLHGDIGLLHVWADPTALRVTALLDFGERASGDPASDLGDLEGRNLDAVLSGYGVDDVARFTERIRFYALARAIPWARKWHSRGETQVLGWLRHVLREASMF